MLPQEKLRVARVIASIAATFISLACGTNYVYSAWAPQFAVRLKLSATESNLIGVAGNLGMYTMGVPIGIVVDKRPRPAVLLGSVLLALGYFPLHISYQNGAGSVPLMCLCSYLSGLGGCMAFAAAVKTSALNWPHHRGTATAFPLAAFGLSAFFFSALGSILARDPSDFLMLLAAGTFGITFIGFFFLKVYPNQSYHPVNKHERSSSLTDSQQLRRTSTSESKPHSRRHPLFEPGTSSNTTNITASEADNIDPAALEAAKTVEVPKILGRDRTGGASSDNDSDVAVDETSSLMSSSTEEEGREIIAGSIDMDRSHRVDIRGFNLLRDVEFWQLFSIMGILAGVGLMTINNIGNDAKVLWEKYDPSVEEPFLVKIQQLHVSILSIGSFSGRLASGVGSDMLVKKLNASRVWCLVIACFIFFFAQICALSVTNPHFLGFVSGLSGLGYGFAFGVFPSIVAETFGIRGLSQNWGFMTLAPVVSGNIFNLFYGTTYDHHSIKKPDGERVCMEGLECYRAAYVVTLGACAAGVLVTLLTIRHQHSVRVKEQMKADEED